MSDAVREQFAAVLEPEIFASKLALAEAKAVEVWRGDEVIVVRGRKVPKGTKGILFWIGSGKFGMRCGINPSGGGEPVWTALDNVALLEPKPIDREALKAAAKWEARRQAGLERMSA